LDVAVSETSPAPVRHVVLDARHPLRLSRRNFRIVVRHHHHGIAIEAFK
jgi:hypothetical protein